MNIFLFQQIWSNKMRHKKHIDAQISFKQQDNLQSYFNHDSKSKFCVI